MIAVLNYSLVEEERSGEGRRTTNCGAEKRGSLRSLASIRPLKWRHLEKIRKVGAPTKLRPALWEHGSLVAGKSWALSGLPNSTA